MKPTYITSDVIETPLDSYIMIMDHIDQVENIQAEWLGNALYDLLCPDSVIDWGCASGLYLQPFKAHKAKIYGIDGEVAGGSKLLPDEFSCMDIRRRIATDHFDLALCIEVGEHLQPEYADVLVENVTNSADIVFWSAAKPQQGGRNHYNEQPISYWASKFAKRGFVLHLMNDEIINAIHASGKCVHWLRRNTRLYGKL